MTLNRPKPLVSLAVPVGRNVGTVDTPRSTVPSYPFTRYGTMGRRDGRSNAIGQRCRSTGSVVEKNGGNGSLSWMCPVDDMFPRTHHDCNKAAFYCSQEALMLYSIGLKPDGLIIFSAVN